MMRLSSDHHILLSRRVAKHANNFCVKPSEVLKFERWTPCGPAAPEPSAARLTSSRKRHRPPSATCTTEKTQGLKNTQIPYFLNAYKRIYFLNFLKNVANLVGKQLYRIIV